jgi:hypothetical protein
MICHQVTLSGDAEWPKVADAVIEALGVITKSPTTGIETPKREKNGRQVLRSDEYTKMGIVSGPNLLS